MSLDYEAMLTHARRLQRATELRDLLEATRVVVEQVAGYRHAWLALFDPSARDEAIIVAVSGDNERLVLEECPRVPIAGDPMMEELAAARGPIVVADARTDPRTNKHIVARLGNRTIVNVPLLLGDEAIGALGTGTFGDEGVRAPTARELDALAVCAAQLAAAVERVHILARHRAVEREREQLQRRLETMQRLESVAMLASGVAHDFANYLQVVFMAMDALERTPLTEQQRALASEAEEAARHARDLARQLLTMGRKSHEPRAVDVAERVNETLELVRSSIPAGISVVRELHATPKVHADPNQLDQVITNLVLNARDAMDERGELRLAVDEIAIDAATAAAEPWARPGRFVRVRVADNGPGMSAELMERVFEPFFTTKRTGTGMGLAIVSRIVAKHGGLLRCSSELGVGTTFDVFLPVEHARAA